MAELSGFEVLALVKEIDSTLRGTYVNNIYTIGGAQLLKLRMTDGDDFLLVADPAHGAWISTKLSERGETSEFTSKLRKELERTRFSAARQVDLDRVFEITFGEGDGTRKLIIEMMPPGNIIVTDGSNRIVLLKNEVRSPRRRVVRGDEYSPPAQNRASPASLSEGDVAEMLKAEKTVGKAIGKHVAVPRKYIAEVLHRISLQEEAPSSKLEGRESELVGAFRDLLREAADSPRPCICETPNGDELFVVLPSAFGVKSEAATVSALCDEVLLSDVVKGGGAEEDTPEEGKQRELSATISKLKDEEKTLAADATRLRQAAAAAARASSVADARKVLWDAGIDSRKEPASQAAASSLAYDKAKELDSRAADVRAAVERLTKKVPRITPAGKPNRRKLTRRRQDWYEKFRWFLTSEGKLAIGGRDAQSNSMLIRRHMDANDVVYHADLFGSPFFVLKGGKEQTEREVKEVAQATAAFSSAWKTGLGSADAYWVSPDQVGTAAPSGEYLARGSFAIKGKKNFVAGNLVEMAIGVDSGGRVVSGPESAISSMGIRYVVMRPHREKGSETAKRVMKDLESSLGEESAKVSLDDVMRALPAGGGKVVRRSGGARNIPQDAP